jgi:choline-sulfatase
MGKRPNILLLYTDQQRYDTIAALGNPIIKTPVLDRLVEEGTAFTSCYTSTPVCIAARFATLSGLPPYRSGCVANMPMPQETRSVMEALQDAGYQTYGAGKMHFHPDPNILWGFDCRQTSGDGSQPNNYREFLVKNGYGNVSGARGIGGEYYYIPQLSPLPSHMHETHWVADRSIDFLKQHDRQRPFFLWGSFVKPHPPFENPAPWHMLYRGPEMPRPFRPDGYENALCYWNRIQNRYKFRDDGFDEHLLRTMRAAYYASISFIDWNIGRILDALGDEIDDTLILFTSDHGEMLGDFGSFGKRCMLEASVHIPMLARWPDKFPAGEKCTAPVSNLDLYPTFLDAAGCPDPYIDPEGAILYNCANQNSKRQFVFSQQGQGAYGLYLITDGRWKYSYSAADEKEWLYDLGTDPQEIWNLVNNPIYYREVQRLRGTLIHRFQDAGYISAVDGDSWRCYGIKDLIDDPDYGLLISHGEAQQKAINALGEGYARDIRTEPGMHTRLLDEAVFGGEASTLPFKE